MWKGNNMGTNNGWDDFKNGIPYNMTCLGTCSLCGGPVCVPSVIWSTVAPTPQCLWCGAYVKNDFGPKIDMVPTKPNKTWRPYEPDSQWISLWKYSIG